MLIDTLAPEPLAVIRPFHVTVEPYEDDYRASVVDANLSAFGETRNEAVWAIKDIIAAKFETLSDLGEAKAPARLASCRCSGSSSGGHRYAGHNEGTRTAHRD
ncbi:MAG: hypothetical protein U1E05_14715 [Patescibacteria group bacterium]|nr:hypothetical protein [Patescibacteria group bacterium]